MLNGRMTRRAWALGTALAAFVAYFQLGAPVVAALFAYTILDLAHRRVAPWTPRSLARPLAAAILVVSGSLLLISAFLFVRQAFAALPAIAASTLPKVAALAERIGLDPENVAPEGLPAALARAAQEHAAGIGGIGKVATHGLFQICLALSAALLFFLGEERRDEDRTLYGALCSELDVRVRGFLQSFELVLCAQAAISAINTLFTAIFLLVLGFPHTGFIIPATFVLGMLPVAGNVLSNTIIVATALTLSSRHAVLALAFLVAIHKGEYFLNSRIVGSTLDAPMWLTLLAILLGELILGVPGIILAPAVLHHLRAQWQGAPSPGAAAA